MDHADHVALLRPAVEAAISAASAVEGPAEVPAESVVQAAATPPGLPGRTWADIGAGSGAFTLALADLLGSGGRIVTVDRDARALDENAGLVTARFPGVSIDGVVADFTRPLELPELDGLVAANSLHYVARDRQVGVIRLLAGHLRAGGRFVVVEYDADRGNPWVPHPFSYPAWDRLAAAAGLIDTRRIGRVPSRFLGAIYAAESRRP